MARVPFRSLIKTSRAAPRTTDSAANILYDEKGINDIFTVEPVDPASATIGRVFKSCSRSRTVSATTPLSWSSAIPNWDEGVEAQDIRGVVGVEPSE